MKKEKSIFSNVIIELNNNYESQAKNLVSKLNPEGENGLIAIDCSPNGSLNPFYYENGLKSAAIIARLAGSFLGSDRFWLKNIIKSSGESAFRTNLEIGEKIGLWERVRYDECQEKLNWNQPFCVKNNRKQTRVWHPDWRMLEGEGFSARKDIFKFIAENVAYTQKFYFPLPAVNRPENQWMHYRLVFYVRENQVEFIGGLWLGRKDFKLFLTEKTTVGLISPARA